MVVKIKKSRTPQQVETEILEKLYTYSGGLKKTHILQKCNVNAQRAETHIKELIKNKHVQLTSKYQITTPGILEYLKRKEAR